MGYILLLCSAIKLGRICFSLGVTGFAQLQPSFDPSTWQLPGLKSIMTLFIFSSVTAAVISVDTMPVNVVNGSVFNRLTSLKGLIMIDGDYRIGSRLKKILEAKTLNSSDLTLIKDRINSLNEMNPFCGVFSGLQKLQFGRGVQVCDGSTQTSVIEVFASHVYKRKFEQEVIKGRILQSQIDQHIQVTEEALNAIESTNRSLINHPNVDIVDVIVGIM